MSASVKGVTRLTEIKRHRPRVDPPMPDPREQRNAAFRIQAFFALRYGSERGRRRQAAAHGKAEADRKLRAVLDAAKARIVLAGRNPDGLDSLVVTPPTIPHVETVATELAKEQPAA